MTEEGTVMRHYMVDPENEERLLKIPPRAVAKIREEAYAEAREAVKFLVLGQDFNKTVTRSFVGDVFRILSKHD